MRQVIEFLVRVALLAFILLVFVKVYEERELEIRFGASYLEYKSRTPMLFPRRPRNDLNAGAIIVDYLFSKGFRGFWIGTGFELRDISIKHKFLDLKAEWINRVYTIGGGYIWTFCDNIYIEPWVAGHLIINRKDVGVYGYVCRTQLLR